MRRKIQHYSVLLESGNHAVDWRWPDTKDARWTMSDREDGHWFGGDPLTEEGRAALLKHFELEDQAEELSLSAIEVLSPHSLESLSTHPSPSHCSCTMGNHVQARYAA